MKITYPLTENTKDREIFDPIENSSQSITFTDCFGYFYLMKTYWTGRTEKKLLNIDIYIRYF